MAERPISVRDEAQAVTNVSMTQTENTQHGHEERQGHLILASGRPSALRHTSSQLLPSRLHNAYSIVSSRLLLVPPGMLLQLLHLPPQPGLPGVALACQASGLVTGETKHVRVALSW